MLKKSRNSDLLNLSKKFELTTLQAVKEHNDAVSSYTKKVREFSKTLDESEVRYENDISNIKHDLFCLNNVVKEIQQVKDDHCHAKQSVEQQLWKITDANLLNQKDLDGKLREISKNVSSNLDLIANLQIDSHMSSSKITELKNKIASDIERSKRLFLDELKKLRLELISRPSREKENVSKNTEDIKFIMATLKSLKEEIEDIKHKRFFMEKHIEYALTHIERLEKKVN